ncbi:PhnD/SsuA/transferrin family substrate-binding protein [Mesorhizobium sp. J428]|uniref:PhnD/SsuA/transferrin family substrate-binding protein n=1 Tax=Mesorhizobium sp. J428 TaxID=2898440 RepID=UPI002151D53D|nr:PhnD/SsuA/transferrin family substrate-binding protein [Mesorhizobium sp. J428]MCR5855279.1 PhnD/SsuA/transferrin family substrate-binding protein [Mesorhizobium sp. J428]
MTSFIAALPMYDWPERRGEVDAEWAVIRDRLHAAGVDAPESLVRRNADLPPVPGGIRDAAGHVVAPDPATLPPDGLDLPTLWRHPALLLAQTCWGPMEETGLAAQVAVVGQPDYSGVPGGKGELYSSAIVMRRRNMSHSGKPEGDAEAPADGEASLPLDLLQRVRLAFNEPHSRSGRLALKADLESAGAGLSIFSGLLETGSHRLSIRAVAEGRADVAAVDCRSWSLARLHDPAAMALRVAGWTKRRLGLPFISALGLSSLHGVLRKAVGG